MSDNVERCEQPDHDPRNFEPGDFVIHDRLTCFTCMGRILAEEATAVSDPLAARRMGRGQHELESEREGLDHLSPAMRFFSENT